MSFLDFIRNRRKPIDGEGKLSAAVLEAMRYWDEQKAAGVPLEQRLRALEGVIRDVWPFTREWKYLCRDCDDRGLRMADCSGDATCGRARQHLPHTFGTPCWCSLGAKFRPKPQLDPDDFSAAGKSRPMTRIGR